MTLPAVAQLIAFDGPGGAERVVAHLARHLAAAGFPVVVVVPQHGEGWLAAELAGVDVTIEPFHLDRPLSPGAVRRLAGLLRRHHVALAHSHEFTMGIYGAFAARIWPSPGQGRGRSSGRRAATQPPRSSPSRRWPAPG